MSEKQHLTPHQILKLIYIAANIYKDKLLDKTFMFVFNNEYKEVTFKKNNFKHLTGVDSKLSAHQFFKNALSLRLYPIHIQFNTYHPYHLCMEKLRYINNIYELMHNECVILKNIKTQTCTYTFGSTNLYFVLLFSEDIDSSNLIVKSLRGDCCVDKAATKYFVDYIFMKEINDDKYKKLCFCKNNQTILPLEVINKLDESLINKIICNNNKL